MQESYYAHRCALRLNRLQITRYLNGFIYEDEYKQQRLSTTGSLFYQMKRKTKEMYEAMIYMYNELSGPCRMLLSPAYNNEMYELIETLRALCEHIIITDYKGRSLKTAHTYRLVQLAIAVLELLAASNREQVFEMLKHRN